MVNDLDAVSAHAMYERYCVPAPTRLFRELLLAPLNPFASTRVNYENAFRAPLLFVAGGADRMVPPSIVRSTAARYAKSDAITSYREYPGRTHLTLGQPGWATIADHALEWSLRMGRQRLTLDGAGARLQPVG